VEQVFEVLKHTLETGDRIKIPGFANFLVRTKFDWRGRNPQTAGEEIFIKSRKVLTFKARPILKKSVNK
jgi:integration host factor subunit alpha